MRLVCQVRLLINEVMVCSRVQHDVLRSWNAKERERGLPLAKVSIVIWSTLLTEYYNSEPREDIQVRGLEKVSQPVAGRKYKVNNSSHLKMSRRTHALHMVWNGNESWLRPSDHHWKWKSSQGRIEVQIFLVEKTPVQSKPHSLPKLRFPTSILPSGPWPR